MSIRTRDSFEHLQTHDVKCAPYYSENSKDKSSAIFSIFFMNFWPALIADTKTDESECSIDPFCLVLIVWWMWVLSH